MIIIIISHVKSQHEGQTTTTIIDDDRKHRKTNSNGDGANIFASNATADLSGSKSNLVPTTESTFPVERNSVVIQNAIINLTNNPVNYIQRIFTHLLNITDDDILANKGHDAYQYLLFQRYIIYILTFLSIVSMTILTPVNMSGGNSLSTYYEMTTINKKK